MVRRLAVAGLAVAAASGCGTPAELQVAAAREIGLVPQSALIQGHDGGASFVAWGHAVWIYGDTPLNENDAQGFTWHSNSFATTDDFDPSDGLGGFGERLDGAGAPLPLVANTDEEAAFNAAHQGDPCATQPCGARWAIWPGAAAFDESAGRAYVFYGLIYAEPGDFNFHGVGQSIAVWSDFSSLPERPVVAPSSPHPTALFGEGEPGYGAAALLDGGFLYSFACEKATLTFPCTMARVPPAQALDRAAWRYWDGGAWSADLAAARALFDGAPSMRVFFDQHLARWIAVYSAPLSDDVVARTAPALTGPWSDDARLFTADRKGMGGWTYDAEAHPELSPDGGRTLYVSHTRPNGQGWFGSETALWRVDLQ